MNDERKIKVYLDTSVISYLDQQDAPEKVNYPPPKGGGLEKALKI